MPKNNNGPFLPPLPRWKFFLTLEELSHSSPIKFGKGNWPNNKRKVLRKRIGTPPLPKPGSRN